MIPFVFNFSILVWKISSSNSPITSNFMLGILFFIYSAQSRNSPIPLFFMILPTNKNRISSFLFGNSSKQYSFKLTPDPGINLPFSFTILFCLKNKKLNLFWKKTVFAEQIPTLYKDRITFDIIVPLSIDVPKPVTFEIYLYFFNLHNKPP